MLATHGTRLLTFTVMAGNIFSTNNLLENTVLNKDNIGLLWGEAQPFIETRLLCTEGKLWLARRAFFPLPFPTLQLIATELDTSGGQANTHLPPSLFSKIVFPKEETTLTSIFPYLTNSDSPVNAAQEWCFQF